MKFFISLLLLVCSYNLYADQKAQSNSDSESAMILLDTIQSVIFSPEGKDIITKSDVDRPSIMGGTRTLDEIKFERLVYLDARKFNMVPTDEMVNKYLAMVAKENNISVADLNQVFTSAGFTRQEAEEQLKRIQAMNSMFDFKIRGNLIVPRKAVEAYYNANPEKEEASYFIEYAFIPASEVKNKDTLKQQVINYARTGKGLSLKWTTPFWIKHSEIAPEKMFITKLKPGSLSAPHATSEGYEIYRLKELKEERLKSFDERYHEIADILRRPKYDELLNAYRNSLFDPEHAAILDFY